MRIKQKIAVCAALLLTGGFLTADEMPQRQTYPKAPQSVRRKVVDDVNVLSGDKKQCPIAYYVVPPLSDIPQLSDTYPSDGIPFGEFQIVAAKNEYEPASAVFYPFRDFNEFLPEATDLTDGNGNRIPASAVDIKLVKIWYQVGSAWYSQYNDTLTMKLIPELLLNDEKMIYADTSTDDNFVRYFNMDKSVSYEWMSARFPVVNYRLDNQANMALIGDAESLCPAVLNKHEFKQYMFTVHVPADAQEGVYTGKIVLNADGAKYGEIPVRLRVLPFELPTPKTYYDQAKNFYLSLYETATDNPKVLKNLAAHNLLNPLDFPKIDTLFPERFHNQVKLAHECGISTRPLFGGGAGVWMTVPPDPSATNIRDLENMRNIIRLTRELSLKELGHTDFYSYGQDEGSPAVIRQERAVWRIAHEAGGKVMVSTGPHKELLFALDYMLIGTAPTEESLKITEEFHQMNPNNLCGWYADPHGGPENPHYSRRAHGIQTWKSNFDAASNYAWMRNNWNDTSIPYEPNYRGLVVSYGGRDGNFDTLQWEGIREGLDDVRYASYMKGLAMEAAENPDGDISLLGRRILAKLAYTDQFRDSPDAFRMECIKSILALRKALKKGN